jgi:hypothetical protein
MHRIVLGMSSVVLLVLPAPAQVGISFFGGLATPSASINDVYNRENFRSGDTLRSLLREAARLGYQLGIRTRNTLSERFSFIGGIALVRFPQSRLYVTDPQSGDTLAVLASVQNLVPISAGVEFHVLPGPLRLSVGGQLSYTILNTSTDWERGTVSVPLALGTQNSHRVGADVGAGIGLAAGPVGIGAEVRYAISNLIGRVEGEESKSYLSLLLVLTLGL